MNCKRLAPAALSLLLGACAAVGPASITRDRFDYNDALANSWKSQMLLNIVKLRYADAPIFLEVSSVVAQYSVEAEIGAEATLVPGVDSAGVDVRSKYSNKPTITYLPLRGEAFMRTLVTPVRPTSVFALVQAGWPVEFVFQLAVRAINGIYNQSRIPLLERPADPEFFPLLAAMQSIQRSATLAVRLEQRDDQLTSIVFIRSRVDPAIAEEGRYVRETLGLDATAEEFSLVPAASNRHDREIAMLTRSLLEILEELSAGIDVPKEHLENGHAAPVAPLDASAVALETPRLRIRSGAVPPDEAFVAVPYSGYWFWINRHDLHSKRLLSFLSLLFSFAETSGQAAPIITVPVGGS